MVSYTMLTQNCDRHPVLSQMHKPDPELAADQKDKRTVVTIERADWNQWRGTVDEAMQRVRPPGCELRHGRVDAESQAQLGPA
jgi:hypothetical protein